MKNIKASFEWDFLKNPFWKQFPEENFEYGLQEEKEKHVSEYPC